MNTEKNRISKKLIINYNNLKVVKLELKAGKTIPEHSTDADVVVITLSGKGIFSINGSQNLLRKGNVLHLKPGTVHAITATTDLELIVNHMRLNSSQSEIQCGNTACSQD